MHTTALDARINLIARRQGGAFTWAQARECGMGKATIGRRVSTGVWNRPYPGVYVLGGAPPTRLQALWAAVLAAGGGALVSHESGAIFHGARGLAPEPLTLTAPHGAHHRLTGVTVHQIDDVAEWHRTTVDGLPVVTAARSVVELGSRLSLERLGDVADDLVQARATTWRAIGAVFRDVARPGKPGMPTVAALLDDRFGTGVHGRVRGLVDAAYLDARVLLETDGRTYHMRLQDMRRDRERGAQAVATGWVTLRFMYDQVVGDPAGVCADIAAARRVRLPLFASAA
jgi:Transcriptional regulator, AbiEi antitoxin/Protein of unknown function (DUF559)